LGFPPRRLTGGRRLLHDPRKSRPPPRGQGASAQRSLVRRSSKEVHELAAEFAGRWLRSFPDPGSGVDVELKRSRWPSRRRSRRCRQRTAGRSGTAHPADRQPLMAGRWRLRSSCCRAAGVGIAAGTGDARAAGPGARSAFRGSVPQCVHPSPAAMAGHRGLPGMRVGGGAVVVLTPPHGGARVPGAAGLTALAGALPRLNRQVS
jgi:hypothetical protein